MRLWSWDGLVFLSPLALGDNSPGRHGRRRTRSSRHDACRRRRQFSLNYELDLRLQPRLGDDVVNFPEAFALQGPPVPRDHLVTWNSRREYPRNRRASDGWFVPTGCFNGNGNGTRDCYAGRARARALSRCQSWKALKYSQSDASARSSSISYAMIQGKFRYIAPLQSNIIYLSRFSQQMG